MLAAEEDQFKLVEQQAALVVLVVAVQAEQT